MMLELPMRKVVGELPFKVKRGYRHDFVFVVENYGQRICVRGSRRISIYFIGTPNSIRMRDAGMVWTGQVINAIQEACS